MNRLPTFLIALVLSLYGLYAFLPSFQTASEKPVQASSQQGDKNTPKPDVASVNASGLTFAESKTVLTVDPSAPDMPSAEVALRNNSVDNLTSLTHRLGTFGFRDIDQAVLKTPPIRMVGTEQTLNAGDAEHIALQWIPGSKVAPGVYEGNLILEKDQKPLTKQPIQVIVRPTGLDYTPLVAKFNMKVYRLVPFVDAWWTPGYGFTASSAIPLKMPVDSQKVGLERSPLLTSLVRDPSGSVLIYWDWDRTRLSADPPSLGLKTYSIPNSGTYTGNLLLGKDKTATPINLTLNATDIVVYPIICLCVGVFLAIKGKQYLTSGRDLLVWRARLLALDGGFREAETQFADSVKDSAADGWSIRKSFREQYNALWLIVNELSSGLSGPPNPSNPKVVQLQTHLESLQAVVNDWASFGGQIHTLTALRSAIAQTEPRPPGQDELALLQRLDKLLENKDLSISEFKDIQAQVSAAISFVPAWQHFWTSTGEVRSKMGRVEADYPECTKAHEQDIASVRGLANDLWISLWMLDGTDDVANQKAQSDLAALRTAYSELLITCEQMSSRQIRSLSPEVAPQVQDEMTEAQSGLPNGKWAPTTSAEDYLQEIQRQDRVLGMLAYVLAILTGLTVNYFGRNFGSYQDYITLFLWAFGVKVGVDALAGGLEGWLGPKTS